MKSIYKQLKDNVTIQAMDTSVLLSIILNGGKTSGRHIEESVTLYDAIQNSDLKPENVEKLASQYGLGKKETALILASVELGRRAKVSSKLYVTCSDNAEYFLQDMQDFEEEHFRILCLNSKKEVIATKEISIGNLTSSIVDMRNMFREALAHNSDTILIAHNHPSGESTPSKADLSLTENIVKSGFLLGCEVADHIIVGKGEFYSLRHNSPELFERPSSKENMLTYLMKNTR